MEVDQNHEKSHLKTENSSVNTSSLKKKIFKPKKAIANILNNSILGIGNTLLNKDGSKQHQETKAFHKISKYNPHENNSVMWVDSTKTSVIALTNKGTLCSWGENKSSLGRRVIDSNMDCYTPMLIKCPNRIMDFNCGYNHVIALSVEGIVFSWGNNEFGQLGLIGFPIGPNSERDEPSELLIFKNIPIKNVYAKANTSFAISQFGNNLYGWGDNSNSQLGINDEIYKKIPTPTVIEVASKLNQDYLMVLKRNGSTSYCIMLMKQSNKVLQSMLYFSNKFLYSKEQELISEYNLIKEQIKSFSDRKSIEYLKSDPSAAKDSLKRIKYFSDCIEKRLNQLKHKKASENEALDYNRNSKKMSVLANQIQNTVNNNLEDFLDGMFKRAKNNIVSEKGKNISQILNHEGKSIKNNNEMYHYSEILDVCKIVLEEGESLLLKHEKKEINKFPVFLSKLKQVNDLLSSLKISNHKENCNSITEIYSVMDKKIVDLEKTHKEFFPDDSKEVKVRKDTWATDCDNLTEESDYIDKTRDIFKSLVDLKKNNLNLTKMIQFYSEKLYNNKLIGLIPEFKKSK